jgi:hypothetical protein
MTTSPYSILSQISGDSASSHQTHVHSYRGQRIYLACSRLRDLPALLIGLKIANQLANLYSLRHYSSCLSASRSASIIYPAKHYHSYVTSSATPIARISPICARIDSRATRLPILSSRDSAVHDPRRSRTPGDHNRRSRGYPLCWNPNTINHYGRRPMTTAHLTLRSRNSALFGSQARPHVLTSKP